MRLTWEGEVIEMRFAGVGHRVISVMKRPHVEFISANGLMISGVVEAGGGLRPILYYQEWWFVPIVRGKQEETE